MITRYQHLVIQTAAERLRDLAEIQALVAAPLPEEFVSFLQAAAGNLLFYDLQLRPNRKRAEPLAFHMVWEPGAEPAPNSPTTIAGLTRFARQHGAPATCINFAGHPYLTHLFYDVPPHGSG
ncbi:hypothetical protein [Anatilimnocola floriformis]|uniref:hypothetical protein n=1 Tax=Anatilimnocola floriformis TaxID=2948575 RepID=UPI0020C34569|nr:hypothetical protein [Anatilimnocola floriformis]